MATKVNPLELNHKGLLALARARMSGDILLKDVNSLADGGAQLILSVGREWAENIVKPFQLTDDGYHEYLRIITNKKYQEPLKLDINSREILY